ncbi:MAG: hypothetical protein ACFCVK_20790 [Acidimicrobiales bacterium]
MTTSDLVPPLSSPMYLHERGRMIEALLDTFSDAGAVRQRVADLIGHVVAAHAAALERLVELASEPDVLERDDELGEVLWVHRPITADTEQFDRYGNQIESLLSAIEQSASPHLMATAEHLAAEVRDLYGEQIERAFELLHDSGQGDTIRAALDDALVASMLVVHDLHPRSMAERVADCLDELAATLPEHGGVAHLVEINDDGLVRIEVTGGSELHRWRTRLAVEKAIDRAAPEHSGVEVIGADSEPPMPPLTAFIPIDSIRRKAPGRTPRVWIDLPVLADLDDGAIRQVVTDEVALVACNVGGDLYVSVDPFKAADSAIRSGDADRFRITGYDPLTIEHADGTSHTFLAPLPVQRTGDTVEVMVP